MTENATRAREARIEAAARAIFEEWRRIGEDVLPPPVDGECFAFAERALDAADAVSAPTPRPDALREWTQMVRKKFQLPEHADGSGLDRVAFWAGYTNAIEDVERFAAAPEPLTPPRDAP